MKPLGLLVLVVVPGTLLAEILLLVGRSRHRRRRRADIVAWGAGVGLEDATDASLPDDVETLALLGRGFARGVDGQVAGDWEGVPVRVADYWYCDNDSNHGGLFGPSYARYTVAFVAFDLELPSVRIDGEHGVDRVVDGVVHADIDFESEAFNRRYRVLAGDREFAYKLLDARMIDFLLDTPGRHSYEIGGRWVAAYARHLPVSDLRNLLVAATGFATHVSRLVQCDYRPRKRRWRI